MKKSGIIVTSFLISLILAACQTNSTDNETETNEATTSQTEPNQKSLMRRLSKELGSRIIMIKIQWL